MKKTILMSNEDRESFDFLSGLYDVIATDDICKLINFERKHADLQCLNINGKVFLNSDSALVLKELYKRNIEFEICENISGEYPKNVALNAVFAGDYIICKESALHEKVKSFCLNSGIKIINVNQGYTKCSTLLLDPKNLITDDVSIARAAKIKNINVLLIEKGDIRLDDNNYGFIGGASAKIGDTVYFFGDLNSHKNCAEIKSFIKLCNLNIKCVKSGVLKDIGSVIVL